MGERFSPVHFARGWSSQRQLRGTAPMSIADLRARYARLDQLRQGLAKEVLAIRPGNDPMLRAERQAYLGSIQDALDGVEKACVTLAKAIYRLERSPWQQG